MHRISKQNNNNENRRGKHAYVDEVTWQRERQKDVRQERGIETRLQPRQLNNENCVHNHIWTEVFHV